MSGMNIMYITNEQALREGTAPEPQPAAQEVSIRVCAAGVIVTELTWYSTARTKAGTVRERTVPGHEFSGVIVAVGSAVHDVVAGQEVFGMNDWFQDGALADFCLAETVGLAPKPKHLTHAEAASVPISALTAWQGLFDRAGLQSGERVLVHGGAGAVGTFAVQLAKWKGAQVVTTASARNIAIAKDLGADQVVDYQKTAFEQSGMFDVVFDTVGDDTLRRSWNVLKPNGRLVTVVSTAAESGERRVKDAFFIVEPNGKQLSEIGQLLEAGVLRTVVDAVFPLAQAPDVYADRVIRRRQGKVVVSIADC